MELPAPVRQAIDAALAHVPLMLVRGGASDVLTAEAAARMRARRPDMAELVLTGIGHAPTLSEPAIAAPLDAWIEAQP